MAIPQLEAYEAKQTLGVRIAPDGNWDTEVDYLLSVTLDWKVHMAASHLSHTGAMFSLKNVILCQLAYPLVTTTFTRQQCYTIMTPLLQQGLPKAGVIQTFPRALVHDPLQYSILDIPQLFMEQVIAHIHTILRYGPTKSDPMGHLLHTTGEAMWLEVGYSGELLMAPLCLAENVTNSWIKHVWVSTKESGVTLLTDFAKIPLQRHGDIELMRLFVKMGDNNPNFRCSTNVGCISKYSCSWRSYAEQEQPSSCNFGITSNRLTHCWSGLSPVHHLNMHGPYGDRPYPLRYTWDKTIK